MKHFLFIILGILFATNTFAQDKLYASTGDYVNVRIGPGKQYNVMTANPRNNCGISKIQLDKGEVVTYLGVKKNGFMKVQSDDKCWKNSVGWVSEKYLIPIEQFADNPPQDDYSQLERKVIGKHMLTLQWISWDYYGSCEIKKMPDGSLKCTGQQLSKEYPGDYLMIDGYITIVDERHLIFEGDIKSKVYHLNGGQEYVKSGKFDFVATGKRKYWREQKMEGPDGVTDYVDIYFK